MDVAKYIEHTNLTPTVTVTDIDQLVAEAVEFKFFGVCVPPFWVKRAKREIGSRELALVTVVGFPLGYNMTETKIDEAKRAIDNGADEIDWVWNLSAFKTGLPWTKIELAKASKFIHDQQKLLKVIIETAYLSRDEIVAACKLCADSGADYVKTSTGTAKTGAHVDNVKLMRSSLPASVGIKAAGGIKTFAEVGSFVEAGADRIGTSSGVQIIREQLTAS